MSAAYPGGVLLVAVLKGSLPFVADLSRRVSVPCEIDFLGISTYTEGTGRVRIVKDLDHDVHDRDVVLVEDIVDTGLTCTYILGELGRRGPGRWRCAPCSIAGCAGSCPSRCGSRASKPPMTCSSGTASTSPGGTGTSRSWPRATPRRSKRTRTRMSLPSTGGKFHAWSRCG